MITKVLKIEDVLLVQSFHCQVWLPLSLRGAIMKMLSFLGSIRYQRDASCFMGQSRHAYICKTLSTNILEYSKCGGGLAPRGRWFKNLNSDIFFVFQAGIISLHDSISCISGKVSCWFTHRFTANKGTKGSMWTASRFGVYEKNQQLPCLWYVGRRYDKL